MGGRGTRRRRHRGILRRDKTASADRGDHPSGLAEGDEHQSRIGFHPDPGGASAHAQEEVWPPALHGGHGRPFPAGKQGACGRREARLHGLAKAVALECGPDGVTANSIAPGWLDTDRNAAWYPDLEKTYEHVRATVPLRTLGTAEDVANACLYLASDMGKFVTGHLLHVNGGEFMV
ncbi:MAG: SDR family oxidoreductase [Mesorhizobium sp.]|nr:SDR family oxidoreductase [Mesorhizobium sp. M2A.F.Ca.ET.043.02.1.1]RUW42417.1 SDR family oxidoreductase [Mesorhizobium sp. M2A.F.Ca.ET.015.02.1.1]RUW77891.1 SDR family oxidoreductase [Mesorhizobium sp. M2A.F.Ca.ET.067.02.1.1]RWB60239.1 MAG: SDR family oxidoreductase [Mesorhizobium sp.]RWB83826.1 MAG: SDR family oxidoreductase [Mesorhizobium sp.]